MRIVYSCYLEFADTGTDAARTSREIISAWASRRYGVAPTMDDTGLWEPREGIALRWQTFSAVDEALSVWKLTYTHPHDKDPGVAWRTDARVVEDHDRLSASVQISLEPQEFKLTPLRYDLHTPAVIRELTEGLHVQMDGLHISERAKAVEPNNVARFADFLMDTSRMLPVIAVTRPGNGGPPVAKVNQICEQVLGLAHVFVTANDQTTYLMGDLLPDRMSVFRGAVRLYWPGLLVDSSAYDHPLWLPDRISFLDASPRPFVDQLFRILSPVAAARIPVSLVEQQIRRVDDRHRAAELERLREESGSLPPEWEAEITRAWDENNLLRVENDDLGSQLEQLRANFALVAQARQSEADEDLSTEPIPIDSMRTAARQAEDDCQHLVFHDQAFESAERSPYRQPQRVYDAVIRFDQIVAEAAAGTLGTRLEDRCRSEGLDFAPAIGETTEGKYRGYRLNHNGVEYVLGPHLRFGKGSPETCARVYFFQTVDGHWVVGHFGRHLADATS